MNFCSPSLMHYKSIMQTVTTSLNNPHVFLSYFSNGRGRWVFLFCTFYNWQDVNLVYYGFLISTSCTCIYLEFNTFSFPGSNHRSLYTLFTLAASSFYTAKYTFVIFHLREVQIYLHSFTDASLSNTFVH